MKQRQRQPEHHRWRNDAVHVSNSKAPGEPFNQVLFRGNFHGVLCLQRLPSLQAGAAPRDRTHHQTLGSRRSRTVSLAWNTEDVAEDRGQRALGTTGARASMNATTIPRPQPRRRFRVRCLGTPREGLLGQARPVPRPAGTARAEFPRQAWGAPSAASAPPTRGASGHAGRDVVQPGPDRSASLEPRPGPARPTARCLAARPRRLAPGPIRWRAPAARASTDRRAGQPSPFRCARASRSIAATSHSHRPCPPAVASRVRLCRRRPGSKRGRAGPVGRAAPVSITGTSSGGPISRKR